ncbi:hypothetical protein BFP72_05740 [Reichenbachiella sp. 5M10]|uniref:lactonase family protein n=1 Tax=Reichenbachiella sp. 5M10 TaxID=1889772 RepID=UPI000C152CF7|nr:lactonase family protein [Reichenbachiella sp. 5M10]PIB34930.1 hypothetical protein BFP72_05740 [Reichenbachiella sp. 5M10]
MNRLVLFVSLFAMFSACQQEADEYWVYVSSNDVTSTVGVACYLWRPSKGLLVEHGGDSTSRTSSYLAIDQANARLYSIDGIGIHAFVIDRETGELSSINSQSHIGKGPCYISLAQNKNYLMVAYYRSGEIASFALDDQGRIGGEVSRITHRGSSIHERQTAPHAHMILPAPQGDLVYATDLGTDQVLTYLVSDGGVILPRPVSTTDAVPGFGPRHLAFHPNGRYVYMLAELTGHVMAFAYTDESGITTVLDTVRVLSEDYVGFNKAADIHVSGDGRFLYASNRGDNSLAICEILEDGSLGVPSYSSSGGIWPRAFEIDPTDHYVLVANKRSATICVFDREMETGRLELLESVPTVVAPQCIKFIKRK